MASSSMVVIFITEKREEIFTNVNCIKFTLMTVNKESEPSVSEHVFSRDAKVGAAPNRVPNEHLRKRQRRNFQIPHFFPFQNEINLKTTEMNACNFQHFVIQPVSCVAFKEMMKNLSI